MVPHVDTETLLAELDQRHQQAAMHRLAVACNQRQGRHAGRLRWALGTTLLRLGGLVLGETELLESNAAIGG